MLPTGLSGPARAPEQEIESQAGRVPLVSTGGTDSERIGTAALVRR
jgi:hypothetical protein